MRLRSSLFVRDAKSGKRITPGWLAYILSFWGVSSLGSRLPSLYLKAYFWHLQDR